MTAGADRGAGGAGRDDDSDGGGAGGTGGDNDDGGGGAGRLAAEARRWVDGDPDPATRAELTALLGPGHEAALAERMAGPVRFGTAGLRAPVRAGPNGMNVAVVCRASAGLAGWLVERGHLGATVVVGRDARHGSARFAEATSAVLAGAGLRVVALDRPLPTPVLAYAVRALGAAAGVQITASHNPPADNGYKVFLGGPDGGAQLLEPADAEIEAHIAAAAPAVRLPTAPVADTDPAELVEGYLARLARLRRGTATGRGLTIALTPMHGVGGELARRALRLAGFPNVHLVASQAEPDPDFPTVRFPNPEEPGATDELLALADRIGADLAIALDPDADRCALGVPDPVTGWRMLTGNETGALLGEHLLATGTRPDPLVATTVASSRMLASIAAAHRARFAETPTGFKWIVRAGRGLVYGFEEALGYCVDPDTVRDKDGIAAAVLAADLVAALRAEGRGAPDLLDDLAVAHGVHLTSAITIVLGESERAGTLARLSRTEEVPGAELVRDRAPGRPTDVFVFRGAAGRAVVRPSGTEPKLKAYLEVVEPVHDGRAGLSAARERAENRMSTLRTQVAGLLG